MSKDPPSPFSPPSPSDPQPSSPLVTVFANASVVVVIKPSGWLSVPSRQGDDDGRPCLGRRLEAQLGLRLWPVHRLDFEVSGLILFAKTAAAHKQANHWFEARQVHKTYEALSEATDAGWSLLQSATQAPPPPWVWQSTMARGKRRAYLSDHGKPAETQAHYLGEATFAQRRVHHWQLTPVTGRPHQLRFDLARHGFPIVGDRLYGATLPHPASLNSDPHDATRSEIIALRCQRLGFADCPGARELGLPLNLTLPSLLDA